MGYDGGAFFSPDSKKLVFRASRPKTPEERIKEYKELLAQNLVMPTNSQICVYNMDGNDFRQVTHLGKANWAPFFTPDGKKSSFRVTTNPQRIRFSPLFSEPRRLWSWVTTESYFNAFPIIFARWQKAGMVIEPQQPRHPRH
ncbi:MAG: hypothetical protein U0Z17_07305 [Bacteroidales bacterium]